MTYLYALWVHWLLRKTPGIWCKRHEWRPACVDRSGLWPAVTIGCRTWQFVPPEIAERISGLLGAMRTDDHKGIGA